ncbi:unnamed protein product [Gongylonema pulchrum]|uniref:Uncharacterized protein n=1 Tax=Gongylonema pulchrum TaxID=637853 RepID=A0A183DC20_9BILA|nr:unnamed protein product [Gongylonema pulchrum]
MTKTSPAKSKPNDAFIHPDTTIKNQLAVKPHPTLQEKKSAPEQRKLEVLPVTNTAKGPKKERKLIGLIAYGIYRSRSYYSTFERIFRRYNDYDDYLVKIYKDDDYVILTKFMQLDRPFDMVASAPPGSNVLIVNHKHFDGGEDLVDMISIQQLRAHTKKLWFENENAASILSLIQSWCDYPAKKLKLSLKLSFTFDGF